MASFHLAVAASAVKLSSRDAHGAVLTRRTTTVRAASNEVGAVWPATPAAVSLNSGLCSLILPVAATLQRRSMLHARERVRRTRQTSRLQRRAISAPAPKGDILPGQPETDSSRRILFPRQSEQATTKFQASLYKRYSRRYGSLFVGRPDYRNCLLQALRDNNLTWLRTEIEFREKGAWDFVFPPTKKKSEEGWCRSPLSLIVRPSEGFLSQRFLAGVSQDQRLKLVKDALESGICSPHFEGNYWSCAAIHAALAGDVPMLQELHNAGLDMLTLAVEWAVYDEPTFTVVHAAALNGHMHALQWLADTYDDASWLDRPDAAGCTPLYYAIQTARSEAAARFLIRRGCNAFACNDELDRSPLSVAVELLPSLAAEILSTKTEPVDSWWGNPVIRFDFVGVAVQAGDSMGQQRFISEGGTECSIESLINRSNSVSLAAVPIIQRLSDRKWEAWARGRYFNLLFSYLLLIGPYTVNAFSDNTLGIGPQLSLIFASGVGYLAYSYTQFLEVESRGIGSYFSRGWNLLDVTLLMLIPFTVIPHAFVALDGPSVRVLGLGPELNPVAVTLDAFLIQLMNLRLLRYLSVFNEIRIGPYLINVLQIVADSWQPILFLFLVVASFALGFVLLFQFGASSAQEGAADVVSLGYTDMIVRLLEWLFQPDEAFEAIRKIPLQLPGYALFLLFLVVAVLGSLRLVQDSTSVQQTEESTRAQFQALRLELIDDLEQQMRAGTPDEQAALEMFYASLKSSCELLQLETRAQLYPRRSRRQKRQQSSLNS